MRPTLAASALLAAAVFVPEAEAAVFRSTYSGSAQFQAGGTTVGRSDFTNYAFTAVYTYNTGAGSITTTDHRQTYTGPLSVLFTIDGLVFDLAGSSASQVDRSQTPPTSSFPLTQSFASDAVYTGPSAFSGDYVAAGVSFLDGRIPPSVVTPFSVTFTGPSTLDPFGSFSLDGGLVRGALSTQSLVVAPVPLPGAAGLFGAAILTLGLALRFSRAAPVLRTGGSNSMD